MLSIIIPSYNQQEYLKEAIESALNQTVKCEVIVVDDGSTDKSLDIAFEYPIKLISQVNKGLASARNTGIMNATGDYCLMLDADDKLLPNAVKRIQETITENSGLSYEGTPFGEPDVVAPSMKCFGANDQEIILIPNPTLEDFKTGNRLGYCAAIKRSALLEVGGYSPRMEEGYEDLHLWINLLSRGKRIITIPEVLWMYRIKKESMYTKAVKYHKKLLAQINKDFNINLDF